MSAQSAEQIGAAVGEEATSLLPAAETPSQHIRNAMGSLYTLERVGRHDDEPGFFVSDDTLAAVYRRLWKAVKDLEARP